MIYRLCVSTAIRQNSTMVGNVRIKKMKLHLTASSERGKPVTKSGNDRLYVGITINRRTVGKAYINWSPTLNRFIFSMEMQTSTGKKTIEEEFIDFEPKTARECDCPSVDCPKHPVEFKEQAEV